MKTVVAVCSAALLCGCAARNAAWRLQPSGNDLVLIPPAVRKSVTVGTCESSSKLPPAQVLLRRRELLASEDAGCAPPGSAVRTIESALDSQPVPARAAWDLRYGTTRDSGHIDIAPGWRVRVITPLLKSGGYRLPSLQSTPSGGNTLEVRAGSDFLGMETSHYEVLARTGEPGIRVRLESVEVQIDDRQEQRREPRANLFALPEGVRHVRLLYLTRASEADHDMAIVGSRTAEELEAATPRIQRDPRAACTGEGPVWCSWVPAGIAVLPQVRVTVKGGHMWVAANTSVREAVWDTSLEGLTVFRRWRGKMAPVAGALKDLLNLPLLGGEEISWRRR